MFTMRLTAKAERKISHASQAPMSVRTRSSMPRPTETTAMREAESSVKMTIGMT